MFNPPHRVESKDRRLHWEAVGRLLASLGGLSIWHIMALAPTPTISIEYHEVAEDYNCGLAYFDHQPAGTGGEQIG